MRQALLVVGKPKAPYYAEAGRDYLTRLTPFGGCTMVSVRPAKEDGRPSVPLLQAKEAERLLAKIDPTDQVWAFDPKGQPWSSLAWAEKLRQVQERGLRRLALIVGGQCGLGPAVLKRADQLVSLGPITLPHELAAVVALEQLYRAHTILAGLPYHRT